MAEHYALIVDEDASFRDRLARLLALVGIELIQASGEDELISLLGRRRPVVVVLAVDLPDKEGFFLFSRVKRVQRNVPVVMTTSTVPRADLKMHEKLRVHADHYIAKTELSDAELFDAVAAVAGQERAFADVAGVGDAEDEREEKAAPSQDTDPIEESSPPPDLDAKLVERLDEETVGILAEIDAESTVIVDSISAEKGELSPERLAELEADVERLAAELEHARRDARSSPFSSEFLSLREVASGKDKEIQELARSIARRDGQVLVVKRKLTELATRLVEAQTERDEKRKAASALEELLEASRVNAEQVCNKAESDRGEHEREIAARASSRAELDRLKEELEKVRGEHEQEIEEITERLASSEGDVEKERNEATESKDELASTIERRMSEHEEERQSKIALIEKLEKLEKIDKVERESSAKVKRLSAALAREKQESRFTRHAASIHNAMQERHEREISELDSRHAHDAKRAEKTWTAKLEHLAKTLSGKAKTAAADQERKWRAKLEMMRREHETSDAALRKELEHKLAVSGHRSEDASRELAELKARLEALSKELTKARKEVGLRDELIAATVRKTKFRQAADPSKK